MKSQLTIASMPTRERVTRADDAERWGFVLLSTFLNILGASLGFLSAMFFAIGALGMHPRKIMQISSSYWDANQHWGDSINARRSVRVIANVELNRLRGGGLSFAVR